MIGRTLAHYRIVEEISRGGMGVVYRATDTRLGRDVALKVLPDDLLHDPVRRERLLQEARAASALEHPHIAVIHAVDDVDGVTFIAMELIRGEKLSDALARGPLSPARALDLAAEVAEGLARAHDTGIVHRDLKPANVMVTSDGHAKIIDFGLAKLTERAAANASTETQHAGTEEGVILGTAAYMSPEQARGARVDHRSDVFSFGVLLYEMLTGRPAFGGGSRLDTLNAILTQPVPPLPAASGAVEVAQDLQRVVAKCTAKEADDRYQGMRDLVVDLRATRRRLESASGSGMTTVAAAPVPGTRTAPARATLLLGIAVLLAVGAAVWLWWSGRDRPGVVAPSGKPSVAVLYFDNNTGDASLDWMRTGLADMLVTDLSQSTAIEVVGTDRVHQILQELERDDDRVMSAEVVQAIAERARVDTVLLGSYVKAGDTIRINARLQNAASGRVVTSERVDGPGDESLFALIDELTRRFRSRLTSLAAAPAVPLIAAPGGPEPGLDRGLAEVTTSSIEAYRHYAEGLHFHERGLPTQALPLLQQAIAVDPEFAMAHAKLAVVHHNLVQFVKRDEHAQRALDLVDRLTARERYYIEGFYYSHDPATYAKSIEAYQTGLGLHPEHQASRHNLALMFMLLERFPEAIAQSEELLRRGTSNPTTSENLAELYVATGQPDRAHEILDAYLGRFPESPTGLRAKASVLVAEGRLDEAQVLYERSEALNPADFPPRLGRRTIGLLRGDWDAVAAINAGFVGAASPFERFLGAQGESLLSQARGRGREALAQLDRAVRTTGVAPVNRGVMRGRQALLLLRQGNAAAALAQLDQALPEVANRDAEFEVLRLLAVAQAAAGQQAAADATLARLAERAGQLPSDRERRRVAWARGEIALGRGDGAAAVAELTGALATLPPHGLVVGPPGIHAPMWYSAALAHRLAGGDAEAIALLERLQTSHDWTSDPDAYGRSFYLMGQMLERRGDSARARDQYARFIDLWGDGDLERAWIAEARRKIAGR